MATGGLAESPFRHELLLEANREAAELLAGFDRRYLALLVGMLARAKLDSEAIGIPRPELAQLLFDAVRGIEVETATPETLRTRAAQLVRLVFSGLTGAASKPSRRPPSKPRRR